MISVLIGLGILSAAIISLETIWPGVAAQRRLRWDILFGTYYVPDSQPSQFGVADSVPANLVGQLLWPFKHSPGFESVGTSA